MNRYSIETKEATRIENNGFLFLYEYPGDGRGAQPNMKNSKYLKCIYL